MRKISLRKFSHKKKIALVIIAAITISGVGLYRVFPRISDYLYRQEIEQKNEETLEEVKSVEILNPLAIPTISPAPNNIPPTATAYLEVPFICQAPLQTEENWKYHEESCEEAAVLQSYLYETGQTMTKQEAHDEILKMIDWQVENFGSHHDVYADELKEFIHGYYEIPLKDIGIVYDATLDDIKKHITEGHPVIVPITGEILQNPYYPHPGYHMLVVIGYTKDRIITNDNGTRRGADFSYDNNIFLEAMNDAGGDIVVIKAKTTTSSH